MNHEYKVKKIVKSNGESLYKNLTMTKKQIIYMIDMGIVQYMICDNPIYTDNIDSINTPDYDWMIYRLITTKN